MPIDALPSISRSDPDFRVKVDDYFLTRLPTFSTQAEAARVQIVAAESTTTSAASTASTAATTATTAAGTATSARDSAVTAKNAAELAAAQAVSGNVATPINAAISKTTPVDADELGLSDSAALWGLKKLTFANLKAWIGGLFVSKSGDTMTGNLDFSGTALRIRGDFSNLTAANQLLFQTSTTNGNSNIGVIPNGTAITAALRAYSASDPTNASVIDFAVVGTSDARVTSAALGSGTALPLTFFTGATSAERMRIDALGNVGIGGTPAAKLHLIDTTPVFRLTSGGGHNRNIAVNNNDNSLRFTRPGVADDLIIDSSGNVLVTGGGGLGYGVGSGGTVTQATSKSTAVTLNKPSGLITMAQGSISANGAVVFSVSNSIVAQGDTVSVCLVSGITTSGAGYVIDAQALTAGQFYIVVRNMTGTATVSTDQPTIQFNIHRGARS